MTSKGKQEGKQSGPHWEVEQVTSYCRAWTTLCTSNKCKALSGVRMREEDEGQKYIYTFLYSLTLILTNTLLDIT